MTEFNFNDIDYKMTDNWKDLTFGQWFKIQQLIRKSRLIQLPPIIESLEMISILCNIEDDSLDEIPYELHIELSTVINQITKQLTNFDEQKWKNITKTVYNVNGKNYSFNSNGTFTAAEMYDIEVYSTQLQNNQITEEEHLLKIASSIIRGAYEETTESGTKYWKLLKKNMMDITSIENDIMSMNCLWISSVVNFFFDGKSNNKKTTKLYTLKKS